MPIPQTFHGAVYQIPVQGDLHWAPPLTRYLVALGTYSLTSAGGTYTLTGDLNLGNAFGVFAKYFTSGSTLPSTVGSIRLANLDTVGWRNFASSGNLLLGVNGSDQLTFDGAPLQPLLTLTDGQIWIGDGTNTPIGRILTGDVTVSDTGVTSIGALKITNSMVSGTASIAYSKLLLTGSIANADIYSSAAIAYSKLSLSASIVNADIASSAAIAYSKLAALTANRVLLSDGSGFVSASSITNTTLGFVDATSSIQTQINSKQATLTTGNLTEVTSSVLTITGGTGAVIGSGTTILVKQASGSVSGFLSSTDWTTFNSKQSTLTLGNLTDVGTDGLVVTGGTGAVIGTGTSLAQHVADTTHNGYLSATDWNTFNGKQSTLTLPLTVANGGTGDSSLTAYAVLTGGTTSTGVVQSVAGVGTSGQGLTSNGAGALPTFQTVTGTGTVNSGTAGDVDYYATSSTAVSATAAFTVGANGPNGITKGTNTNDSAAAGMVGEYIESVVSSNTSVGTSATAFDMTSVALSAGDWDVTGFSVYTRHGATVTNAEVDLWISTTSGNSFTGSVQGNNFDTRQAEIPVAYGTVGMVIPAYRMSVSGPTTVYLKGYYEAYSAATPQFTCRLSARRTR